MSNECLSRFFKLTVISNDPNFFIRHYKIAGGNWNLKSNLSNKIMSHKITKPNTYTDAKWGCNTTTRVYKET